MKQEQSELLNNTRAFGPSFFMVNKTQLKYFYLLTFPPLILLAILLLLVDSNFINTALFIFGYTFGLVSRTPGVDYVIGQKKYRFSFLRLCYRLTNFVIYKLHAVKKPILLILIRSLLPGLLIGIIMLLFQVGLNLHYTLIGALLCEVVIFILRRYIPKDLLAFG